MGSRARLGSTGEPFYFIGVVFVVAAVGRVCGGGGDVVVVVVVDYVLKYFLVVERSVS